MSIAFIVFYTALIQGLVATCIVSPVRFRVPAPFFHPPGGGTVIRNIPDHGKSRSPCHAGRQNSACAFCPSRSLSLIAIFRRTCSIDVEASLFERSVSALRGTAISKRYPSGETIARARTPGGGSRRGMYRPVSISAPGISANRGSLSPSPSGYRSIQTIRASCRQGSSSPRVCTTSSVTRPAM